MRELIVSTWEYIDVASMGTRAPNHKFIISALALPKRQHFAFERADRVVSVFPQDGMLLGASPRTTLAVQRGFGGVGPPTHEHARHARRSTHRLTAWIRTMSPGVERLNSLQKH